MGQRRCVAIRSSKTGARRLNARSISRRPGDAVLIAGKGHEAYQEFADTVVPFNDRYGGGRILQPESNTVETLRLEQLAELCDARLIRGEPNRVVERISIDSRALGRGDCFVALRGPHFDGHEFISDVARLGASAAVVSNPTRAMNSPSALSLLQVQDTLTALHKLATNYRRLMPPTTRLVAITGSSGKTTTKELIASVLGERFNVVESSGNNNNHIGVPLNLLRLDPAHDFGVFELGTNHPGEIAFLTAWCGRISA